MHSLDISWWPPSVGSTIRMRTSDADYLCHVISVVRHQTTRGYNDVVTIAHFGRWRRGWHYQTVSRLDAEFGVVRPGARGKRHRRSDG